MINEIGIKINPQKAEAVSGTQALKQ